MSVGEQTLPFPEDDGQEPIHLTQELVDEVETVFAETPEEHVEQTRDAFEQACGVFAHDPSDANLAAMNGRIQDHTQAFHRAITAASTDASSYVNCAVAQVTLAADDYQRRGAFLNELTGVDLIHLEIIDLNEIRQTAIDREVEDEELREVCFALRDSIHAGQCETLQTDVEQFVKYVYENIRESSRERILRIVGEAAKGVGTTAAGVVIGGIILRRIFK